jgi:predicted RNase H-like HicB family nuclease
VALCPELDVASQGDSLEEARANLIEALTLFFETANASEMEQRFHSDLFVTQVEVPVGKLACSSSETGGPWVLPTIAAGGWCRTARQTETTSP